MTKFETRTSLYKHQVDACNKLYRFKVGGLFMEMGTGKTRTALELIFQKQKNIDKIIYFCPVSLKFTVQKEIIKHTNLTKDDIYIFDQKTSIRKIPKNKAFYIIGIESVSHSKRMKLCAYSLITERTFIVLDESTYIKTHNATRTEFITTISEKAKYRIIMTGTPLTQGVIDLFAQMKFLSVKILGYRSFYSFAANHIEYSEKYPGMILSTHNTGLLASKINPFVYQVTKAECLDLPVKIYKKFYYCMTCEQRLKYEDIKFQMLMKIDEDDFTSYLIFQLFTELQKCLSGIFTAHDRIKILLAIISGIPIEKKIIIWAKYIFDIESIKDALGNNYAEYTGKLSEKGKEEQIKLFKTEKRFFVATPSSGGHGLTLNEASFVIFYNNSFKYSERMQAEDRCHRIGQTEKVTYIDICCCNSLDEKILTALSNKESIVNAFKEKINAVKNDKKIDKNKFKELIKEI